MDVERTVFFPSLLLLLPIYCMCSFILLLGMKPIMLYIAMDLAHVGWSMPLIGISSLGPHYSNVLMPLPTCMYDCHDMF